MNFMIFKIIGIIFLILLLFTDLKQVINKIKQFFNK
uniref:Orf32 n=7 Tax=Phytophthora TaxID=4783 RepID=D0F1Q7_PHYCR|nr:orf32 [Phytophthora cryptogea]